MIGEETLSTYAEVLAMRSRLMAVFEDDDAGAVLVIGYEDFEEQES